MGESCGVSRRLQKRSLVSIEVVTSLSVRVAKVPLAVHCCICFPWLQALYRAEARVNVAGRLNKQPWRHLASSSQCVVELLQNRKMFLQPLPTGASQAFPFSTAPRAFRGWKRWSSKASPKAGKYNMSRGQPDCPLFKPQCPEGLTCKVKKLRVSTCM